MLSIVVLVPACTTGDTGTFTNNTAEAKTNAGTDFSMLGVGTSATFYVGLDHIFNTINFDINTAGSGVTLVSEYYNGSAWTAFSSVTDNTSALIHRWHHYLYRSY